MLALVMSDEPPELHTSEALADEAKASEVRIAEIREKGQFFLQCANDLNISPTALANLIHVSPTTITEPIKQPHKARSIPSEKIIAKVESVSPRRYRTFRDELIFEQASTNLLATLQERNLTARPERVSALILGVFRSMQRDPRANPKTLSDLAVDPYMLELLQRGE